jgi:hypothetical protein
MQKPLLGSRSTDIKFTGNTNNVARPEFRTVTGEEANLTIIGKCTLGRSKRYNKFLIFILKILIPASSTTKKYSKKLKI